MFERTLAVVFTVLCVSPAAAELLLVQSTTSTQNSGLFDHLLPIYEAESGVDVRVVAVGTGQALENARNCDGDLLIVHAPAAEAAFVEEGFGELRRPFMYNDFVIVGPASDPAGTRGSAPQTALQAIASEQVFFASRGDDSGTHKKERALWATAATDPSPFSGDWYLETGSGMGATLNIAAARAAYTLTDRATWIAFANKGDLEILVEGDPALFNQYSAIAVTPARCPDTAHNAAVAFVDWLASGEGQMAIADYRLAGEALFTPNAD